MKHTPKITFILLGLFLLSQFIGLFVIDRLHDETLSFGSLTFERPEFEKETSYIPIFAIIIIVTILALFIVRFNAFKLWKLWFFLSIFIVLGISLLAFVPWYVALLLSFLATFYKIVRPNVLIQNLSELFIYGGLAAIFVPIFSVFSISILLILIAGYDVFAVWKSKHMIKLAKFQSKAKVFIGLFIPYGKRKNKVALLGGGDLGIPLLFTGVIFLEYGLISLIIPLIVAGSLFFLLSYGKKNKFYPAMPFLGAGCFIGYGIILLLNFI